VDSLALVGYLHARGRVVAWRRTCPFFFAKLLAAASSRPIHLLPVVLQLRRVEVVVEVVFAQLMVGVVDRGERDDELDLGANTSREGSSRWLTATSTPSRS